MGLNVNSSLMMKNANSLFEIPDYTYYCTESFYIKTLENLREFNNDLREAKLEFYSVDENQVLSEGTLTTIFAKISKIFDSIIATIRKFKDAILSAIREFSAKMKNKSMPEKDIEKYKMDVIKFYDSSKYVSMNIYSNTLSDAFLNRNDPPTKLDFSPDEEFNRMQDKLFSFYNNTKVDPDQAVDTMKNLKEEYHQKQLEFRRSIVPNVQEDYFGNPTDFRKLLTEKYIGLKSDRIIDQITAIQAAANMSEYDSIMSNLNSIKNELSKEYDKFESRMKDFRTKMIKLISEKEKHADQEKFQDMVANTAFFGIAISDIINSICSDHLIAISVKLDCISTMIGQDYLIRNTVKKIIGSVSESYINCDKDAEELNEAYFDLYESTLLYEEAIKQLRYRDFIYSITEAEENSGTPNNQTSANQNQQQSTTSNVTRTTASAEKKSFGEKIVDAFKRLVNLVRNMYEKFVRKITELPDKNWLEQNKSDLDILVLPKVSEGFGDWITFDLDALQKPLNIPSFDPNNSLLMKQLENEDTFAKEIYKAIGTKNESKLKGDESFIDHCKGLYGLQYDDGKIAIDKVQSQIDTYRKYCVDYVSGSSNSIPKSIESDMKRLDRSKMAIEQVLKDLGKGSITTNNATTGSQTDQNTTTGEQQTQESSNIITSMCKSINEPVSAAEIFGLVVNEVKMPNAKESYKNDMKEKIQTAGSETGVSNKEIEDKAMLYFRMVGNALGARMTMSFKAHKQYMDVFKWALKNQDQPQSTNNKENDKEQGSSENIESEPLVK